MRNLVSVFIGAACIHFARPLPAQPTGDAWARPGVPVVQSPPRAYASDPQKEPGFRPGGTYTEIIPTRLQSLTPTLVRDAAARRIVALVMEPLAALDAQTLTLRGVLADAWQSDPEGKWLRVHLNPAAKYSDGKPVRASDVVFSFTKLPGGGAAAAKLAKVEAIGEDSVEFTFEAARFSNVPDVLTGYIFAEHVYGHFTEAQLANSTGLLFGSGPFTMTGGASVADQWKSGPVTLVRSANAWSTPAVLEQVVVVAEPDAKVAKRRFLAEDIDAMTPSAELYVEASVDEAFLKVAEAREFLTFANNWQGIIYHCGEREGKPSVFADARVRRAMTMLIDREEVVNKVFGGIGETITGPGNPQLHAYDASITPLPADAAKAKALLDEAGWRDRDGDGLREDEQGRALQFTFVHPNAPASFGELAKYLVAQSAAAGIRCTPEPLPPAQANARLGEGQFDAALFGTTPRDPEADPEAFWHSRRIPPGGSNFARYRSPRADALIDRAVSTLEREPRLKLWRELHAVFADEQPCTFIRTSPTLMFVKRTVGNVKSSGIGPQRAEFFKKAAP